VLTSSVAACGARRPFNDTGFRPEPSLDGGGGTARDGAADDGAARSDPGFVGLRRLSDAEYVNTVQAFLGVSGLDGEIAASVAAPGDVLTGFDDVAGALAITPVKMQRYFATAVLLAETAFADPETRARIVTCAPANPDDGACTGRIVRALGLRAWRRPLAEDEVAGLVALVRARLAAGDDFPTAIEQLVVALLVSESFLYRVELDPSVDDVTAHRLSSYELASRLSYLLWSTMPDDALLAFAAADALFERKALAARVTTMLADPRADGFVRNFMGQWLGFRDLYGPTLARPMSAGWTADLQRSMAEEARLFADVIVRAEVDLGELFTLNVSFIDYRLAELYRYAPPKISEALVRFEPPTADRRGYLGLAAPLTLTSDETASSPTRRGAWVLEHLLCMPTPPGPGSSTRPPGAPREQFDALSKQPGCAGCHVLTDPLGLALETFDEIGAFRRTYADAIFDSAPIDTRGVLPPDEAFTGLSGLEDLLAADDRVRRCAARNALTYALGRGLGPDDDARLEAIHATWREGGGSVRALLAAVVVDDAFRFRRAEGQP
jgi:hypothetical protein